MCHRSSRGIPSGWAAGQGPAAGVVAGAAAGVAAGVPVGVVAGLHLAWQVHFCGRSHSVPHRRSKSKT